MTSPTQTGRQERRGTLYLPQLSVYSGLDDTHAHWGGRSAVSSSSRDALTDTPRNDVVSSLQSGQHIKLTREKKDLKRLNRSQNMKFKDCSVGVHFVMLINRVGLN